MKLWILGGTAEGRELLSLGLPCIYTVATEYGAELAQAGPHADVRVCRLDAEDMNALLREEPIACVLDATHPYAVEASRNAVEAARRNGLPYVRVLRQITPTQGAAVVGSATEAARYLADKPGNILLATGSKELEPFWADGLRERIFLRVLPTAAVLARTESLGIPASRIIAMQGPFSREMNAAILRQISARYLVTKDGGAEGGTQEKLDAARATGAEVVLINRPPEDGFSLQDAIVLAKRLFMEAIR
jgi:precorrin-6x reductase